MKTYKITEEQINLIVDGVDKFINYVNEFHSDYFEYYQDMNKANEQYKRSPETFFENIGINKEQFFEGLSYYKLLDIAYKVKDNICDIHSTVIGMFINPDTNNYPIKVKEWLHEFKHYCYDDNNIFLSLEEQNNRLKNYPHFDASTKKPKSYNTQ